jgi:RimJ/RimL family protein N-acetyltransferase
MPHLFGERIRLRAAEKGDIPNFLRWVNDPEVTENLLLVYPMCRVEEENWYDAMLKGPAAEHVLVIDIKDPALKEKWQAIGTCQFHNINWRNRNAELGIMIGEKSYWNQGYGTETMRLLLKFGFEVLNLHRIYLQVYEKNAGGIRAYQKAGFRQEGTFRQALYQHGRYYDIYWMSVLKDEWQKMTSRQDN